MITYRWDKPNFLHIIYTGVITGDELIQSALDIAGEQQFDNAHFVLGDWSHYTHSSIDEEGVKALVSIMKSVCKICPQVRNAVVIRADKSGNALPSFYKMLGDILPWKIEIFNHFKDAYNWLDQPYPVDIEVLEDFIDESVKRYNKPYIPRYKAHYSEGARQ
ncbi:MAG: hypothetical protein COA42_03505 [Alteromonadaceae bacterium]|nr:MAG: hypothetical protein COA42_03505 [Alteromonadaceae bacterium]